MFVDLDDEHENDDETDDNESEVESHNELVYFLILKKFKTK